MKHVRNNDIVPFQVLFAHDQEVMSGYSDKDMIFYGWEFFTKCSKIMFTNTSDGVHM